ncbi:MAG TPA: hypothetical protein ENH98_01800 [archaeon]|nr:hypothetical protein [archaeon]
MVKKPKTEKQLIKELIKPDCRGLNARQLRFISSSSDKKLSSCGRKELRKRGLKLKGKSFP